MIFVYCMEMYGVTEFTGAERLMIVHHIINIMHGRMLMEQKCNTGTLRDTVIGGKLR